MIIIQTFYGRLGCREVTASITSGGEGGSTQTLASWQGVAFAAGSKGREEATGHKTF